MTSQALMLALIPLAYLLGSVPFGYLVARSRGIDLRTVGSGNIGATNAGRALGKKVFILVFLLDMLKGALPMIIASIAAHRVPETQRSTGLFALWLGVGVAAVLGHVFSLFLRFRGGKGVATTAGVMLGLWPYHTLPLTVAVVVFVAAQRITRTVSAGSVAAALAAPAALLAIGIPLGWPVLGEGWPLTAVLVLLALLIIWRHRENLARLRAGTETKTA